MRLLRARPRWHNQIQTVPSTIYFYATRLKETTIILSSGLAGGGDWPAISDNGAYVSFNSGTDDIYLFNVDTGQRQLINDRMQFSALNEDGQTIIMSGYDNLVPEDTNNDKDVYLVSFDSQEPPVDDEEPPIDEQPPTDDDGDTAPGDSSGFSCSYNPDGHFDPVLPGVLLIALAYLGWGLRKKPTAAKQHALAQTQDKTCIDCHKGIAHKLSDEFMEKEHEQYLTQDADCSQCHSDM